jgi:hypothetical protein
MGINVGSSPVGQSQRVGQNQKQIDPKRAFNVSWNRNAATVAQVIGISGVAHVPVENPSEISVKILFNNNPYASAENVQMTKDGKITAQWKVQPFKMGSFTSGAYDVQITYRGFSGKTTTSLKIVPLGGDRNVSSFG